MPCRRLFSHRSNNHTRVFGRRSSSRIDRSGANLAFELPLSRRHHLFARRPAGPYLYVLAPCRRWSEARRTACTCHVTLFVGACGPLSRGPVRIWWTGAITGLGSALLPPCFLVGLALGPLTQPRRRDCLRLRLRQLTWWRQRSCRRVIATALALERFERECGVSSFGSVSGWRGLRLPRLGSSWRPWSVSRSCSRRLVVPPCSGVCFRSQEAASTTQAT